MIKSIDNEITEEKQGINPDIRRLNRLEEQKLIEGLFSDSSIGSMYGKYRNPW
jgi:polyphosphate kinase